MQSGSSFDPQSLHNQQRSPKRRRLDEDHSDTERFIGERSSRDDRAMSSIELPAIEKPDPDSVSLHESVYSPVELDLDEQDPAHLRTPKKTNKSTISHLSPATSDGLDSENEDPASSPAIFQEDEPVPKLDFKPTLILKGHKSAVASVKCSPDGNWIASCSADATCRIWDAMTGKHQHTLEGHLAGISTIAWSPDSKILASGSDDKSIRFWDTATGKAHTKALIGHDNYVYCIAFSPKGNMLVSGSYDEAVFLWDVRTARLMRSLPAHSDPVGGVDFVCDGTLVVSCSSDGLIRVWDTATGQCLRTFFHEDTPPVVSVRFTPNGKFILTWMLDSTVRMWNYVDGRCVKTYKGHKNEKYSLGGAFGSYGEESTAFIASGSEDGLVYFWDVVSKMILQRLTGHDGPVLGIDVHPSQKMVVSCGRDCTLRIWTADSPSHLSSSPGHLGVSEQDVCRATSVPTPT